MHEVTDLFRDALKIGYDDTLTFRRPLPNERDVAAGNLEASPSLTTGRLTGDPEHPIDVTIYDEEIAWRPEATVPPALLGPCAIVPGRITAVDSDNKTYTASSCAEPFVTVVDQSPRTRPFDYPGVFIELAEVNDPCTILFTTDGAILWQAPERFIQIANIYRGIVTLVNGSVNATYSVEAAHDPLISITDVTPYHRLLVPVGLDPDIEYLPSQVGDSCLIIDAGSGVYYVVVFETVDTQLCRTP